MPDELPVTFSPAVAQEILEAVAFVRGMMRNRIEAAPGMVAISQPPAGWVTVSNTAVTNGTQPGNLHVYNAAGDSWSNSASIRVKQANGYGLATNDKYWGRLAGLASNSYVYVTRDRSGQTGNMQACNAAGTGAVTIVVTDGIIESGMA